MENAYNSITKQVIRQMPTDEFPYLFNLTITTDDKRTCSFTIHTLQYDNTWSAALPQWLFTEAKQKEIRLLLNQLCQKHALKKFC